MNTDTDTEHASALDAKIFARNRVNACANRYTTMARLRLAPFVGKKIMNAGNVLADKVRAALPTAAQIEGPVPGPQSLQLQIWQNNSPYSLYMSMRVCELDHRGHGHYAETTVTLGELGNPDNKLLKSIATDTREYRADFTADEIRTARTEAKTHRQAMEAAQSKFSQFGEYDP